MPSWKTFLSRFRRDRYSRRPALVLLNGLAEQEESWYRNVRFWNRYFDVHMPGLLVYEGAQIQKKIKAGEPIDIDYLVGQLHTYVTQFIQHPPYSFVTSSLGGKVAIEFAYRYPELVHRLVLICPSGMGDVEKLPIIDGVRRSDYGKMMTSILYRPHRADRNLVRYFYRAFATRAWKLGFIRTVRGTNDFVVRSRMAELKMPVLFVAADQDRIVSPVEGQKAAHELKQGFFVSIPHCGHAPQIEKPKFINRLAARFLLCSDPSIHPRLAPLSVHQTTQAGS